MEDSLPLSRTSRSAAMSMYSIVGLKPYLPKTLIFIVLFWGDGKGGRGENIKLIYLPHCTNKEARLQTAWVSEPKMTTIANSVSDPDPFYYLLYLSKKVSTTIKRNLNELEIKICIKPSVIFTTIKAGNIVSWSKLRQGKWKV